ncbi:MAG: hypothetical protein Q9173_006234 [Seirophora scorigena]
MYNSFSVDELNALLWTLTAVGILLSTGRFAIRYASAGRFHLDDASHLLSVLLLIGLAAAYTHGFPYSARIASIGRKEEEAPPLTDPFYHHYLQLRLVVTLLVFMVLWSVKATFLIFYRLLFDVSQTFFRLWCVAVALTFATFWVIDVCLGECSSAKALHDIRTTYKYWCALNVGTDLIVMALPLYMISSLQLRPTQKAILGGVFSLGLVVPIVDILRTVESLESGTFSGVALWSSLEVTVAVIVASLPLYRVLLTPKGRSNIRSRLSGERYKDVDDSPAETQRKGFGTLASPGKRSVSTYHGDLETQDSEASKYSRGFQQVPLAHMAR